MFDELDVFDAFDAFDVFDAFDLFDAFDESDTRYESKGASAPVGGIDDDLLLGLI